MATVEIRELIKPETGEKFYPYAHLNGVKGAELLPRIGTSVQTTQPVPIFQVKDALNAQFYPQTHADAVIGLAQMIESNQFFVKESDGNGGYRIKLKDEYTGFYANGWAAAGGIGTGGGGGGGGLISTVYGESSLGTIYSPGGSDSLTATFSAFSIDKIWQTVNGISLSNGSSYSTLVIKGTSVQFYTKAQVDGLISGIHAFEPVVVSSLPPASENTMYKLYLVPSSTQQTGNIKDEYITIRSGSEGNYSYSWELVGSTAVDLSGYVTTTALSTWAGSTNITTLGTITTGEWSGTAIGVTKGGTGLTSISKGAILYASASNTILALSANGTTTKKFLSQTNSNAPSWAVPTLDDVSDGTTRKLANYLPLTGGTMTGTITMSSGNLVLATTSYIDIGPVRLEYDSTRDALHIVTNDATNHPNIGFWVDGFNAAGGYGSNGGGGGIITSVYGASDLGSVYSIGGTEDFTKTFSAFAIDKVWQTLVSLQNSTPDVSLTNGSSYSTLWVNNTSVTFYTKSQVDSLLGGIHAFDYVTASSLPTAGVDTMYKIYLVPSADPQTLNVKDEYITVRSGSSGSYSYSWEQIGSTAVDLSGYVTTTALGNWTGSTNITTLGTISTGTWSGTAIGVTKGGTGLTAITKGAILYASAANTISALSANGTSTKKFLSQTSSNAPSWGTISLTDISGTSDLQAIEDLSGTSGFLKKTASNTWTLDTTSYLASGATLDSIADGNTRKLANYLPLAGGTMTGTISMDSADIIPSADLGSQLGYSNRRFSNLNVRTIGSVKEINFKDSNNSATTGYLSFQNGYMILRAGSNIDSSYKQINFHETYGLYPENGSSVNLGYYSSSDNRYRWANIYGVNADLTGNLVLSSTSHIDIGIARIEYDSTNKAIHITTTQTGSSAPSIGLYTDGFNTAGGVGSAGGSFSEKVYFNGGLNAMDVDIATESSYVRINCSTDRLYIQHGVTENLVLTDHSSSHTIIGQYTDPGTNKLYVNGTARATAWNTTSDARLKEAINIISGEEAIDKLMRLLPVTWVWNERSDLQGTVSAGLIAQQVEDVIPYMVTGGEYKGLNYTILHAFEISAIQSHEERIRSLEKENKSLRDEIERLRA